MLDTYRSLIRLSRIGRIAVVPVFAAVSLFAQNAAGPPTPVPPITAVPASPAPASETSPAPCKHSAVLDIPLNATIQAKVMGPMDSARLKVGKEIWVYVDNDVVYPGCKLNAGAAIYAHVTSATTGQGSNASELSLSFDHDDCDSRNKKGMPLRLIALLGPSENVMRIHEEIPLEMRAAKRNINDAVKVEGTALDKFSLDRPPRTLQPGTVMGIPKLKLEVEGGPGCSARISSTDRSVLLTRGMEFIFVVESN